ncbi:rarD protein [Rubellimicrobium thermophilum DSM 16684]|uniref:RarD protein n=1 Tax=Rubellimicrobium thermophilum DSM 16684 TaxID=1123069 RepID=S9QYX7_9RHOB|nr:EamA family transporter RarD [Rubellimicrobium thermophilum]EPX84863.1 rarD protein [Rubellimicrobium thermophilum DSM 16684]
MEANGDSPKGLALALAVYLLWGFLPLYMVHLSHVPPAEVILHRVLWSVPIAAVAVLSMGKGGALGRALRRPRMLGMAAVTAAIVSLNWGIYVWAVTSGHALEAALGYYINPLFSVFLGAVLLRERLAPAQWAAIGLAALAVGVLTWDAGRLPMAALGLTLTWGAYAFFKKWLPMGPSEGFLLEVLILSPFALLYLGWLMARGQSHFLAGDVATDALLLGCGVVTAVPLLLYAHGAKLLRLSTIGILQYISPTLVALVAVAVLGEHFGPARMVAFPMIWAALAIYTASFLRQARAAA